MQRCWTIICRDLILSKHAFLALLLPVDDVLVCDYTGTMKTCVKIDVTRTIVRVYIRCVVRKRVW